MFSAGIEYWIPSIQFRIMGTYLSGGITNTATVALYSLLTGIVLTNFWTQMKASGAKMRNLRYSARIYRCGMRGLWSRPTGFPGTYRSASSDAVPGRPCKSHGHGPADLLHRQDRESRGLRYSERVVTMFSPSSTPIRTVCSA